MAALAPVVDTPAAPPPPAPEPAPSDPSAFERLGLTPPRTTFTPAPPPPNAPAPAPPRVTFTPAPPPPKAAPATPAPVPVAVTPPAPPRPMVPKPAAPVLPKPAAPVVTLDRPVSLTATPIEVVPLTADGPDAAEHESLATRVAALPRVLLDTVAWGGFAAVVALIVIALSDVGMGRAALWAVGLSGIVVLAVAVMAVTGTHLDDLNRPTGSAERPD